MVRRIDDPFCRGREPVTSDLTIVIVAKNAASTIARAVRSACAAGDWPILLVDDHCDDETVQLAQDVAGDQLRIVKTEKAMGVGNARQTALDHLASDFAVWLDADDMILPGRPQAMLDALSNGADLVFDPVILFDSASGNDIQLLPIPDFLQAPGGIGRMFERNWIPALTCGFRASFARTVGFARTFQAAEDYDFLLRAITAGARHDFLSKPQYRYAHSPASLSRDLSTAQSFTRIAHKKHPVAAVEHYLANSALGEGERHYTLACLAAAHDDATVFNRATNSLKAMSDIIAPYGRPASWLAHFLQASHCFAHTDFAEAYGLLQPLADAGDAADAANNLGVALWQLGHKDAAQLQWQGALHIMPGYLDATLNLKAASSGDKPDRITQMPLRCAPARATYGS